ncbi:hypothetical protein [Candidatus Uabimicrobium sp. HlEnr_7]|uniref:hypothetical protein n=1 Tax=Candidatus Uabimicrobium helgolandensis TaxID=3095367 RepID=UPI00355719AD
MYKIILFTILGCLLSGCGNRSIIPVRVAVDVPAEINLIPYKKIKLVMKEGKYTSHIKEELEARLKDSFEITEDNGDVDIFIFCSEKFNADKVEEISTTKVTRIETDRKDETQPYKNKFTPADVEKTKLYTRHNVLELDVKFEIVADDKVIATKTYNPKNTIKQKKSGTPPEPVDSDQEFIRTLFYVLREFSRIIVPGKSYKEVNLKKVNHPNFDGGLSFARQGKWKEAMNVFNNIRLENNSDKETHARNIYNYAVCLQYTASKEVDTIQRLEEAVNMYEKAYQTFPEELYKSQKQFCSTEIQRIKRLQAKY